jgi:hypothetical protein
MMIFSLQNFWQKFIRISHLSHTWYILVCYQPHPYRYNHAKNTACNKNCEIRIVSWDLKFSRRRVWRWLSSGLLRRVVWSGDEHRRDDGGSKHLWNVGKLLSDYTAQQPRRRPSSYNFFSLPKQKYSGEDRRQSVLVNALLVSHSYTTIVVIRASVNNLTSTRVGELWRATFLIRILAATLQNLGLLQWYKLYCPPAGTILQWTCVGMRPAYLGQRIAVILHEERR